MFRGGGDAGGPSRSKASAAPEYVRHVPKFLQAYSHMLEKEGFKDEATKAWEDYTVKNKAGKEFGKEDDNEDDHWVEEGDEAPTVVRQGSDALASEWQQAQRRSKEEVEAEKSKDKGNTAYGKGQYEEALRHFNRAIVLTPNNHVLYSNRSACHSAQKNYKAALEDARKVVQLKPEWAKGHSRVGAALVGLKEYADAVAAYERAASLEPGNEQVAEGLKQAKELLAGEEAALERSGKVKFTKRKLEQEEEGPNKQQTDKRKHKPMAGSAKLLSFNDEDDDAG